MMLYMSNSFKDLLFILTSKNDETEPELNKSDAYTFRYLLKASCFIIGALLAYITLNCTIEQTFFSIFGYIVLSLIYGAVMQLVIFVFYLLRLGNIVKIYFLLPSLIVLAYSLLNGK